MKTVKGFDKNLQCRGMQYEIGKTFETEVKPIRCTDNGFHSCENPIDVFYYYPPGAGNRYCETVAEGEIDKSDEDSKIASQKITIGAEISIKSIVEGAIKFVFSKCKWEEKNSTTGDSAGSQATGCRAGSQATGDSAGSQATGDSAGSQATGYSAGSQATGYRAGSQATGYRAMSSVNGAYSTSQITNTKDITSKDATAIGLGPENRVRAPLGCWIVSAEWDEKMENILRIKTVKVDGKKIKPDVWYQVKNGKFVGMGPHKD